MSDITTSKTRLAIAFEKLENAIERTMINAHKKGQDYAFEKLKEELVLLQKENDDLKQENARLKHKYESINQTSKDAAKKVAQSIKQLDLIIEARQNGNS